MEVDRGQFWNAIKIWCKNSHVVNRRLSAVSGIAIWKVNAVEFSVFDILTSCQALTYQRVESQPENFPFHQISPGTFKDIVQLPNNDLEKINISSFTGFLIISQKLLPHSIKYRDAFRIVILDSEDNRAVFINIPDRNANKFTVCPEFPYQLCLRKGEISLECDPVNEYFDVRSHEWLKNTLLARLNKWALSENVADKKIVDSLKLVPVIEYNILYQELKEKYGKHIVKIWPETTDPSKFVYEDVAIATYLLLLWRIEREKLKTNHKQSFVDLGCGNGLLVYILNSEGHPGKGIDLRKRGIWDMYPDYVKLEVDAIVPTGDYLYKDFDWLIGNHSDELSPWVPVIAARSSYKCNFFLLPCCAYEFDGRKYQRRDSSKSQYNEYLEYIEEICNACGVGVLVDRLKIPSTKRICFVGTERLYTESEREDRLVELRRFIADRSGNAVDDKDNWSSSFKPRDPVEKVRNCTRIDKSILEDVVDSVANRILRDCGDGGSDWREGEPVKIGDLIETVSAEKLKRLKNEFGGVQTLLKNHRHIFVVRSGSVKFRRPEPRTEYEDKSCKSKNKRCWFFDNHPDGCPLSSEQCRFVHFQ